MDGNLGPREQSKRRLTGYAGLAAAAALAAALALVGAPRWSRAAVFVPVWIGALGLLQAREKV